MPHEIALLDEDLRNTDRIINLVREDRFATDLYRALCNMGWYKLPEDPEERMLYILKNELPKRLADEADVWTCTWRFAASLVADLRNNTVTEEDDFEDYMDWYCFGGEGTVSDEVTKELSDMCWYPTPPWPPS